MDEVPAFLQDALRFQDPHGEALRDVKDSEWNSIFSSWYVVRLVLPLRQVYGRELPDWVRAKIDTYLADTVLRFERIKQVYSVAARAFKDANVEHMVIKGFSLWPGYVDHPRLRPQYDIDLYCPPESIARAREALSALGYWVSPLGGHLQNDHVAPMTLITPWQWRGNFFDPDIPISFELHFRWWDSGWMRIHPRGLEEFWSRRIERQLDDITFPALHPVDNVGYVALNLLRDFLRGSVTTEQAYGLARFLQTSADDEAFWRSWPLLHDESLRRLEVISFGLASNWFACRLPEEVQKEMDRLPVAVQAWFRHFASSSLRRFDPGKDSVWLHLSLLESLADKSSVLFRRLVPIPSRVPTFASVVVDETSKDARSEQQDRSDVLRFCRRSVRYIEWFAFRVVRHLRALPLTILRGLGYWLSLSAILEILRPVLC